jgi:cellulose synthase (UDP-forming)
MRLPWAVVLLSLLGLHYLIWRLGSTLNLENPTASVLSLVMLSSELMLLANGFLQLWLSLAPRRPVPVAAWPPARPWSVDVLVPSYGEPPDLIERCLGGCQAMAYPHKLVWLLDDSGRPELEALCRRLGCRYLSRQERRHAKAGNLNHALAHCSGDLVAVFDADVVPLESFLQKTVGLFDDPAIGFVQTPQSYMNADPVMRNLRLERWLMPDEESFYRWIQSCRHDLGAVVCAGTSFVMRREALDRVGGFETGTPSEDLATGIRVTAAGYRGVFLGSKLSAGLAPLTAAAMARQRCRWAGGTLQVLRTGASPLRIRGLGPLQRLAYLEGIVHWFGVLPQMALLLMPLSLGLLGVAPIRVSGEGLLTHALPFLLMQMLLVRWFTGHARTALLPELYRWLFLVPLCGAVLRSLLGRPQKFRVTPKALATGRRLGPAKRLLLPLLFLLSLQLLALLHLSPWLSPSFALATDRQLAPISAATLGLGVGTGGLNLVLLLLAIRTCWDRGGGDGVPWFAVTPPHAVQLHEARNPSGGALPAELHAFSETGAELMLPGGDGASGPDVGDTLWLEGLIPGEVLPLSLAAVRRKRGILRIGGRLDELDAAQRLRLQERLYRREGLWPVLRAPFEPRALLAVGLRLLQPVPAEDWFRRSLIRQASPSVLRLPAAPWQVLSPQPSSRQASP